MLLSVAVAGAVTLVLAIAPTGSKTGGASSLLQRAEAAITAPNRIVALSINVRSTTNASGVVNPHRTIRMRQWTLAGAARAMQMRILISEGPLARPSTDEDSALLSDRTGRVVDQRSWTPIFVRARDNYDYPRGGGRGVLEIGGPVRRLDRPRTLVDGWSRPTAAASCSRSVARPMATCGCASTSALPAAASARTSSWSQRRSYRAGSRPPAAPRRAEPGDGRPRARSRRSAPPARCRPPRRTGDCWRSAIGRRRAPCGGLLTASHSPPNACRPSPHSTSVDRKPVDRSPSSDGEPRDLGAALAPAQQPGGHPVTASNSGAR
ncbi:MAG: hypothetical protein QOJ89_494, partial [bacterium]